MAIADITQILAHIGRGDGEAADQLLPLVYDELRRLAKAKLAQEKPGQTLQGTALVHEAYLRLVDRPSNQPWDGRGHFFAAAAEAMRRILVEQARGKATHKRKGHGRRLDLDDCAAIGDDRAEELIELNDALEQLEQEEPQAAQLVKLRYFAGLSHQEAAEMLGISRRAADRLWLLARTWLFQQTKHD